MYHAKLIGGFILSIGEVNKTPQVAADNKPLDVEGITGKPIWSKFKAFSSGTLKRNKKRNLSENSTSS